MERRLTPRGRDRRRQLMDYAARRFSENGYHPTSVAEIVEGLGVGKGVFYWYFSSKEELLLEILKDAQTDLRRTQQAAIGDEPDPIRRIEKGIRASLRWLDENRHLNTLTQFAATESRFYPVLRANAGIAAADVARHVREAIEGGQVQDADPDVLARCIMGVTDALARVYVVERRLDSDTVADWAVAFCLEGLASGTRV